MTVIRYEGGVSVEEWYTLEYYKRSDDPDTLERVIIRYDTEPTFNSKLKSEWNWIMDQVQKEEKEDGFISEYVKPIMIRVHQVIRIPPDEVLTSANIIHRRE